MCEAGLSVPVEKSHRWWVFISRANSASASPQEDFRNKVEDYIKRYAR